MDSKQKKGINFDLDTESLKKYYPKGDWHNAYNDLRTYFEKNGFEHIQGSGYHSKDAMSEANAMAVIYTLKVCTISDVPELYDISHVFEREVQNLSGKEIKSKK